MLYKETHKPLTNSYPQIFLPDARFTCNVNADIYRATHEIGHAVELWLRGTDTAKERLLKDDFGYKESTLSRRLSLAETRVEIMAVTIQSKIVQQEQIKNTVVPAYDDEREELITTLMHLGMVCMTGSSQGRLVPELVNIIPCILASVDKVNPLEVWRTICHWYSIQNLPYYDNSMIQTKFR